MYEQQVDKAWSYVLIFYENVFPILHTKHGSPPVPPLPHISYTQSPI